MPDKQVIRIIVAGEARPFRKKTMSWQAKDGRSGTHAYDESKYAGWKDHARLAASRAMTDETTGEVRPPIDHALSMTVNAYFSIPESTSNKTRQKMLAGIIRPCKIPDWDNVAKACGDAMIGIAIRDDKFIVSGTVLKWYSERPRVTIDIEILPELPTQQKEEQTPLFSGQGEQ